MKIGFMKKNCAVIAVLAITASLFMGCGDTDSSRSSSSTAATEAKTETSSSEENKSETADSSSSAASSTAASSDASSSASSAAGDSSSTAVSTGSSEDLMVADTGTQKIDPSKDISVTGETSSPVTLNAGDSSDKNYVIHSDKLDNIVDDDGDQPQIVVFGDSQFDNVRDSNGLGMKLAYYTHCTVYNCAIGGSTATVSQNTSDVYPHSGWNDTSFIAMAYAATGQIDSSFMSSHYAYNVFNCCDLSKTDVFVIEYGVNDFLTPAPLNVDGDRHAYLGAMKQGIYDLMQKYPKAKIVVCTPTYAQFFSAGNYVGDSNMLSNGYGTLANYAGSAVNIAKYYNQYCFDAYTWLGISGTNAENYLEDGIHLNAAGREMYAKYLARVVLNSLGYQTEYGTDLSTFDYSTLKKNTTSSN